MPAVAQAMSVVFKKGNYTVEVLREAAKEHVPAPIRSSGGDTYTHGAGYVCSRCFLGEK